MPVLFAGTLPASFNIMNKSDTYWDTTAGYFDADRVPGCIQCQGDVEIRTPTLATPVSEYWIHFEVYPRMSIGGQQDAWLFTAYESGAPKLRLSLSNDYVTAIQYLSSSSGNWINIYGGFSVYLPINTLSRIDIHVKHSATVGEFDFYLNGVVAATFSGDTQAGSVDSIGLNGTSFTSGSSYCTNFSQVIWADESTLGMRFNSAPPTGAGTTNTFDSGTYADVDEISLADDTDFIASATADQIMTAAVTNIAAGEVPLAVAVNARCATAGSGPANLNLALRSGGTDYFSGDLAAPLDLGPVPYVWNTDPDTAAAWTEAGFNAIEAGVRSRA